MPRSLSCGPAFLLALLVAPGASGQPPRSGPSGSDVVAVIPFSNITGDPGDDWIGAGIAETITADLQRLSTLTLVGLDLITREMATTTREMATAGGGAIAEDDGAILVAGRRVGARWVINGGYQRLADVIRITARIVDIGTGAIVRTLKVDGAVDELFALQDQVAAELAGETPLRNGGLDRRAGRVAEPAAASPRDVEDTSLAGRAQAPSTPASDETPPVPARVADGAATPEVAAIPSTVAGGGARVLDAIDGPPPPLAPAVVSRDESGNATVRATRISDGIRLDGRLDEPVYESVQSIADFIMQVPTEVVWG